MDEESNLKRQARRRLIGAVALATAVVVLLPMLLDSEPKLVGQDIELRIPDRDKAGEFAPRIDLPPASEPVATITAPPPVSAPVIAAPAVIASQVVVAPQAASASKAPEGKPAPVKPKEAATPETKPAGQSQVDPQSGFVVQIGAFTKTETAHYLQKKLSKEGFKIYTEKVADKTRVRAGPYATREAADKIRLKLEAQGLHPVVSSIE